jgi:F-type H+-transporting ATPase subunit epsilon
MAEVAQGLLQLEVVTPNRQVLREAVSEIVAAGSEGYFGVLPGHLPFLTTLKPGYLTYWRGGTQHQLALSCGFAEVRNDHVSILADTAERAEEIDVDRAQRSRERAETRLKEWAAGNERIDNARAEAALRRSLARLEAARAR